MAVSVAPAPFDEAALVEHARRGDREAFGALVRAHRPGVERLARRLVGPEAAEDVAQQAFLRAWEGLDGFRGEAAFGTWLYRTTTNLCLDHRRRQARRQALPLDAADLTADDTDVAGDVAARAEAAEQQAALAWALAQLPAEERRLLELRVSEGRSYNEIAARTGLHPTTVGTRLHRSRGRLQRLVLSRLAAAALLATLLVLAGGALAGPSALASLGLLLRQVVLREETPPRVDTSPALARTTVEEAQRWVPWQIRQPAALPDGYALVGVYVGEIHAFAEGPTVVLRYRAAEGGGELRVVQLRARAEVPEPVDAASARVVEVGGRQGLFVEGRWVPDAGGQPVWRRGDLLRLILEDEAEGLVLQFEADPRDGWDLEELRQVAAGLE